MNQQRLQQEPSMEEILASIRRIISEDEAASNKSRAPTGPTMPASASGTPGAGSAPTRRPEEAGSVSGNVFSSHKAAAHQNGGHQNGIAAHALTPGEGKSAGRDAPAYAAEDYSRRDYEPDYGEDTVLDLTEMVAEDGSVVTIAPVSADGHGDDRDSGATYDDGGAYTDTLYADPAAYPAAYGEAGRTGAAADDADYDQWNEDPNGQQDGQRDGATLVLKDGTSGAEPAQDYATTEQDDYDDYPAAEPAAAPATARVLTDGPRETAHVEVVPRDDPRTVPASRNAVRLNTALAALAGGDKDDGGAGDRGADVRADEFDAAPEPEAAGAYDETQSTVAATQDATADFLESSALEEMIRETMKPMLREWLDNNLTRLVEDVAREELHRMIESRGGL